MIIKFYLFIDILIITFFNNYSHVLDLLVQALVLGILLDNRASNDISGSATSLAQFSHGWNKNVRNRFILA